VYLPDLPPGRAARIAGIDWHELSEKDGRRLRELGFDEGVAVESLHRAPFGGDPLAVQVGRMMIALRRAQARAVRVEIA
jgi:ferrous iron transport protein A